MRTVPTGEFRHISAHVGGRKPASTALIVIGALTIVYVGLQYGQMFYQQNRMAAAWNTQQQFFEASSGKQVQRILDHSLTRLVIPKLDLTSFIVEGTDDKSLLLGPGHVENTALPGALGNSVISAHRDTFFRHLHELVPGDEFYVERGGKKFVYQVTEKKIVEPTDVWVLRPTEDAQMTLITCYPTYYIGPAPQRLVVFSKLMNAKGTSSKIGNMMGSQAASTIAMDQ